MYPANQYMDPYYSHYKNHAPYPYYPPPGCWEVGHPRMATDTSCRPPSYGPWPSMSHLHPPEFHSCCNHTYPPGYYNFRPPSPQEILPPHLYYHGPFPHHPNAYPSYFAPPLPYPVEQTTYDYDKFKSHCCGCPNHICHADDRSNVKIEEEGPEVKPDSEKKGASSFGIIQHPHYENQNIWLPSGSMKDKENKEGTELPPQFVNGWIPVSGKRIGDEKQQDKDDQKTKQFQWPIIWMPARSDEKRKEAKEQKEMDEIPKVSEEAPPLPKIKIIPLSWFENGQNDQKPSVTDESYYNERSTRKKQSASNEHQDGRAMENIHLMPKKESEHKKPIRENYKTIPVMPRNDEEEKTPAGGNYRTIPVMPVKQSDDKKPDVSVQRDEKKASITERGEENQKGNNEGPSKAKHSKLPPVCLRVDPLPRKKSGNGSSRSPSPPTRKDADGAKKEVKEVHIQKEETEQSDPKKEIAISEAKGKASIEMNEGRANSNETVQAASVKHMEEEQVPTSLGNQKAQATIVNFDAQENSDDKNLHASEKNTVADTKVQSEHAKDGTSPRINYSESDAAVCIQSAYRGYNVRRWRPLEKLQMIKNVNEQMQDLKRQLQGIEACSKQLTFKEHVAINETIMNLLLKLDTIQGLHPNVREARKSVARELISLQEKLDSLCKLPSSEPNHTNGDKEKPKVVESTFQSTAPVSEIEASEKDLNLLNIYQQEKAAGVDEEQDTSTIESNGMMRDAISSVVFMDPTQDADSNDHIEESNNTKEEAANEGKAATQCDCQREPSMDVMSDAALLGHSTEQKHQIEESNALSRDGSCNEEKDKPLVGGLGIPSRGHVEPLHDVALSEDSNELQQCTISEKSNTATSPAATDNSAITMATTSIGSGVIADEGIPVEGQVPEAAAVESSESEHDVAPAEDQCEELNAPVVNLEDSLVSLKNEKLLERNTTPSSFSVVSNLAKQLEEARDVNVQQQIQNVDTAQDATKGSNGTQETRVDNVTSTGTENYVQSPLLQATSELQSATEQDVLEESIAAKKCAVSGENDSVLGGKQNESAGNLIEDSANVEEPPLVALGMEGEIHESAPREMKDEPTFPEAEISDLSCEQGGITGHEDFEICVPLQCKLDVHKERCSDDEHSVDVQVPKEAECNIVGADNLEEDVSVRKENMASEEASLASGTPDDMKVENKVPEETAESATPNVSKSENENKLAQENQKLKEMLQKLLASGSDQMGVITELSDKVKALERKLAHKKRPKVFPLGQGFNLKTQYNDNQDPSLWKAFSDL
uniref:BAG domain-containing protein n=1 Tax=Leersia perrieri TaxID=77586 RepID=A0A0D9VEG6_9ORYZ